MIFALMFALAADQPPNRATISTPREVVLAMFDAFNRHDADAMARLYAKLTSPDYCHPRGRNDVSKSYRTLFAEYPDIRDDLETVVAEGDIVAVRFTATSRAGNLTLPIQAILKVRDGLIVTDDALFDAGGKPCER
jgi:predicted SnoaL-like aldol condensation-catalyzing enzyme